ncbi:hypothetical protein JXA40_09760 [bacterium]|nr:hypothetical protein [candidate division CSSED10-310 bacterium]
MAHAYTPGLKVSPKIRLTKKRILPLKGDVVVNVGDTVTSDTVVARTELPGKVTPINAANILGVPAPDLVEHVLKPEGSPIAKGEIYAVAKSFFGLFKTTLKAPEDCHLENISQITGKILLRGKPLPVEVTAYLEGKVTEVYPQEGVAVECWAAFTQGIFGIGGETHGILRMVCKSKDERLSPEKISPEHRGCVLVGGSIVTAAALKKALEHGVRAIVVGGFDDQDLRNFLGYDLGVAITGSENKGITLVVTEGFGEIPMADRTFELLKNHEGHKACVNGATQIRAGVIRPEVVIPRPESELKAGPEVTAGALIIGTPIRVIREPYFGRLGTVSLLPPELTPLESETKARVLKVKFADGIEAVVPRANVEILET